MYNDGRRHMDKRERGQREEKGRLFVEAPGNAAQPSPPTPIHQAASLSARVGSPPPLVHAPVSFVSCVIRIQLFSEASATIAKVSDVNKFHQSLRKAVEVQRTLTIRRAPSSAKSFPHPRRCGTLSTLQTQFHIAHYTRIHLAICGC